MDVDVQARREAAYARAGVRSLSHRPYQLAAFAEDMKLAVSIGAVTETEAEAALRRVQTLSEDEISEWRSIINAEAFGGETLSWIKGQIRDAGGDL